VPTFAANKSCLHQYPNDSKGFGGAYLDEADGEDLRALSPLIWAHVNPLRDFRVGYE